MTNCCVIGGTGFIGTHVVELLRTHRRKVTIIGRKPELPSELPEDVNYLSGDYSDENFLLGALAGVDEIIDLAYSTVPKTSYDDPIQDIQTNLPAAVKLFTVANLVPVKKLVVVSSGGVIYGSPEYLPISESHQTNPINPYGITKLATEKYAMMYHRLRGLPVVCVRPANGFGVGQLPFIGQGFIATAMASIMANEKIELYGKEGTVRDYIYVTDIARGIIAVLDKGKPGSIYNIGTGVGRSNKEVLDIIEPIARSAGFETKIKILPPRGFDVAANILDCSKLTEETGWEVKISFTQGVEKTWEWMTSTSFKNNRSAVN
jgi:UDP-glucose 4-epimerase